MSERKDVPENVNSILEKQKNITRVINSEAVNKISEELKNPTFIPQLASESADSSQKTIKKQGYEEAKLEDQQIIENLEKEKQEAEKKSIIDSPTGLYNRNYLEDYVSNFDNSRSKKPLVIVFCDADNLGAINKEKGDDVGDQLIKDVAMAIKDSVRQEDKVIRKGGDEFIVIIENFSNFEELKKELSVRFKSKQTSDAKFSFGIVQYDANRDYRLNNTIQRGNNQMREDYPNKKVSKH
jgi:diguanylate cyclase (GGDEF)-like protein